jgi:hypothetical protein
LYRRLKRTNATIHYVLSDGFHDQDSDPWPHQDPGAWKKHVEQVARDIIDRHWNVVWEPWNEPDYWPGDGLSDDERFSQYLDAFLSAYRAIKAMDPTARFAGPSLSAQNWPRARRQIELFLNFCSRHSLEVSDLTWHGFDDQNIDQYPRRVSDIRRLARNAYPSAGVQKIFISEIVAESYFTSPGDLIATLKYLDDAGVDGVGRSCWSDVSCWNPTLDGAVIVGLSGFYLPTPMWWANYWYASFVGQRFSGRSSHPGIVASAVIDDGTLNILLGFSAAAGPAGSRDVVLKFQGFGRADVVANNVVRLPDLNYNELTSPIAVHDAKFTRVDNLAFAKLNDVRAGDAYLVQIHFKK